jgi:hypothetical protein
VTSSVHRLFGRLLMPSGFKQRGGVQFLMVLLPDGSPGTIPGAAPDILGADPVRGVVTAPSVEGIWELRAPAGSLKGLGGPRLRPGRANRLAQACTRQRTRKVSLLCEI